MTDTQIAALREVVGRMTPGEWQANGSHFYGPDPVRLLVGQCLYPMGDKSNDIAGIVALRNTALPIIDALEAKLIAERAENARLREGLAAVANMTEWSIIEAATNNVRQAIKADIRRVLRVHPAALEGRQS